MNDTTVKTFYSYNANSEDLISKLLDYEYLEHGELKNQIYAILRSSSSSDSKLCEILYLQFVERADIWSLDELVGLAQSFDPNFQISQSQLSTILDFDRVLNYAKHNRVTFKGVDELCPEVMQSLYATKIKESMVIDPLQVCKKLEDTELLFSLYESEDVRNTKVKFARNSKAIAKTSNTLIRDVLKKNLSFEEWTKNKNDFFCASEILKPPTKSQLLKIEEFENNHKFKLSLKDKKLVREFRTKTLLNKKIEFSEMQRLRDAIGPFYFKKTLKFLWKGLKVEFNKLKKIKNKDLQQRRALSFLQKYRYSENYERIWQLVQAVVAEADF